MTPWWYFKPLSMLILPDTAGSSVHVQDVSRPLHGHTHIEFGKDTVFGLPTTRAKNLNQNFDPFLNFQKRPIQCPLLPSVRTIPVFFFSSKILIEVFSSCRGKPKNGIFSELYGGMTMQRSNLFGHIWAFGLGVVPLGTRIYTNPTSLKLAKKNRNYDVVY